MHVLTTQISFLRIFKYQQNNFAHNFAPIIPTDISVLVITFHQANHFLHISINKQIICAQYLYCHSQYWLTKFQTHNLWYQLRNITPPILPAYKGKEPYITSFNHLIQGKWVHTYFPFSDKYLVQNEDLHLINQLLQSLSQKLNLLPV